MKIRPARRLQGRIHLPGDKSISHRAAIVAALAAGKSTITNFSTAADCASTLACLQALGVAVKQEDAVVVIEGRAELAAPTSALDCGNSGSTMRFLTGVLAGQDFTSTLVGDVSLSARPMSRVIEPLRLMGAEVRSDDGKAPLTIRGSRSLKAIKYELPMASAQVKTAILLAALRADGETQISESQGATRDHTERLLQLFGAEVTTTLAGAAPVVSITGPATLSARHVNVPGDISSAAYFIAAAALLAGSDLTIDHVGLNPTRTAFLSLLSDLGLTHQVRHEEQQQNEPRGSVQVLGRTSTTSTKLILRGKLVAQLIDELPLLAVIGSQMPAGIEIRDAQELRIKESDRIATTVKNLRAMGIEVEEVADGMKVSFGKLKGATIESNGDHRIAMAFAVAALLAEGDSEIRDAECVAVSFPEFFETLAKLCS